MDEDYFDGEKRASLSINYCHKFSPVSRTQVRCAKVVFEKWVSLKKGALRIFKISTLPLVPDRGFQGAIIN